LAELRLGQFLAQVPRASYTLATKVGFLLTEAGLQRDYSREGVLRSLEASLQRLQVSQVDLLYVHDPDEHAHTVLDETFPALAQLRAQGVVKALGVGMNQWRVPQLFLEQADFDCFMIAGRYTLLEQGAAAFFDACHARNVPILAASIYNSGILAQGAASPHAAYNHGSPPRIITDQVAALTAFCEAAQVPLLTAATQFPLTHPAVKTLVVGFQHPQEVAACRHALQQTLPPLFWRQLQAAHLLDPTLSMPIAKEILS
jgi:D-threo-aldose 1-dehydrogenase